jgi:tRNA/tmRNA/rRNA uracil-C5-methylase (TrmA/RlmC/RlmD family)
MHKEKSTKELFSFEQSLKKFASCQWDKTSLEPLVNLDYDRECQLKDKAFAAFLKAHKVETQPNSVIPSPKPRNYRTTTKRRVSCTPEGLGFGFAGKVTPGVVETSLLEPLEHQNIYEFLQKHLATKTYSSLARALNWLIIRGTYERQFLILNIYKMDASVVRKAKQLTELLKKENVVEGAMLYFDPTRSEYYLETEKPPRGLQIKHLFGPKSLGLKVNDTLMRYSTTGFSQVNESMVQEMINKAQELLAPKSTDHLLDLYCGYGLFSHTLGQFCKKITGIELSAEAIDSAREIAKRLKTRQKSHFYAEKIDAPLIKNKFEPAEQRELVLLDPPRNGCEPGVIAQLALRNPKRVLHIFCGTNEIPREIKQWKENGYSAKVIQPIDMFAGTTNLETMVLLEKE